MFCISILCIEDAKNEVSVHVQLWTVMLNLIKGKIFNVKFFL